MKVEQSIHLDTNIPSDDHANRPIEIEEEEEQETTQEASQSRSKGKQVAKKYFQQAECWQHFIEIKKNDKRVTSKCEYSDVVYKANPNKNGTKDLKNHFPKWSKNPDNQSKQTQAQLIFENDQNNEREVRVKSWVLNPHEAREL